jgi:hypothetical protein
MTPHEDAYFAAHPGVMDLPDCTGRQVTVEWEDTTNMATWLTASEVDEFAHDGSWVCSNIGWVSYQDADCIVVSSRRSSSGHWGLSERIPAQAVIRITAKNEPDER